MAWVPVPMIPRVTWRATGRATRRVKKNGYRPLLHSGFAVSPSLRPTTRSSIGQPAMAPASHQQKFAVGR